jgi:predicted transcriptional regulator
MSSTIQARLDPESQKRLAALVRQLGWTPSRVVREALRVLAAARLYKKQKKHRTIIGQGQFHSGIGDLSTNKEHMRDFGR